MAAPLSGVGQQQQVPVSNATTGINTSDQSRQIRQEEQEARENELQTRAAPLSQSQNSSEDQSFTLDKGDANNIGANDISANANQKPRGSLVDITV